MLPELKVLVVASALLVETVGTVETVDNIAGAAVAEVESPCCQIVGIA